MKYALALEVKLLELPDEEDPIDPPRPGDDPMAMLGGIATKMLAAPMGRPVAFMGASAGFDFRKQIEISVHDFSGAAQIVARFDHLLSDIEAERLSVKR